MTASHRPAAPPALDRAGDELSERPPSDAALEITSRAEIRSVLDTLGRTEDLVVSPNGDLIAIAAFHTNTVALLRVAVHAGPQRRTLDVQALHLMRSNELDQPHGVDIADEHTLIVANRAGELVAFPLPEINEGISSSTAAGHVIAGHDDPVPLSSPGSVRTRSVGGGLVEALVCDNYTHRVVRYVVDPMDGMAVLDADDLLHERLEIPDGVAVSPCGRWVAISNHSSHEVFIYDLNDELGPASEPTGSLWGANYPHGLQFTADGRHLIVADAGLPYLHSFAAPDGDWSGRREAHHHLRVMDDEEFHRGRYNPQEGGPKGLTIWDDRGLVLVTIETAPLRAFELADALGVAGVVGVVGVERPRVDATASTTHEPSLRRTITRLQQVEADLADARRDRDDARADAAAMIERLDAIEAEVAAQAATLERLRDVEAQLHDAQSRLVDTERRLIETGDALSRSEASAAASAHEVQLLRESTSWRATRPLRAAADTFKGRRT